MLISNNINNSINNTYITMKHFFCLALLTVAANLPAVAWAEQPSAADRTTARRLGTEGVTALRNGDFDTAADRFERANDLVPAPSFQVLLARARSTGSTSETSVLDEMVIPRCHHVKKT